MENQPYPIIGMSPGNSYFKDAEIRHLLKETVERFGRTCIFVADVPAIATYLAYGYPENKARTKAIPKGNNLKNRTRRIRDELGIHESQVRIVDWANEVATSKAYQRIYDLRVRRLYDTNIEFSRSVDATTQAVLEASEKPINDIHAATKIAIHYLLSELAFLEFAPQFLDNTHITYVYHRNWPVYEDYISGKFDGQIRPNLDFLLLENPSETYIKNNTVDLRPEDIALRRVQNSRRLKVAFADYYSALMTDPENEIHSGIFADVLKEFARRSGWTIDWTEEVGYGVITTGLNEGRYDLFGSTVWPTPEREGKALFSDPLYHSPVYAWKAENDTRSYADVKRSSFIRIAVKEGDISHTIAKADFPKARLVRVPQLADPTVILNFVAEGRADITFVEPMLANHFHAHHPSRVTEVNELGLIRSYPNTFMLGRGQTSLQKALNETISLLRAEGILDQLIERYTGSRYTFSVSSHVAKVRPLQG